jgi:hypothetical protein
MGKDARRCEAVRASQAHHVREQTGHKARRATRGIGEGQGAPHDPERGHGQSSRRRVPRLRNRECLTGKVGNQRPRDPREGRRRRAARAAGGTSGSDAGITNHLHAPPEHGRTGTPLAGEGVQHRVAPDRRRRPAGSLPPHPEGPCAGGGQGDGEAVGRAPGGEPSRPAGAVARQSVGGAAGRAGLEGEGRGEKEADQHALLRGHDGPAGGGEDRGGALRAGVAGVFPRLSQGAQCPLGVARAA